jgi:chromosome segregation ATPase
MMTMPATVLSLPSNETQETIDFLRRLASMMTGGRNAETLLAAAAAIETLSQRATTAEGQLGELQDEHAKNLELREVAELAADNLLTEATALKEQLAKSESQAETETAALKAEFAEHRESAEAEIGSLRLQLIENERNSEAEIAALKSQLAETSGHADDEIASLKSQLAETSGHADEEIAALKAQVEQRDRLAEIDRRVFAEEAQRLQALAQEAESRAGAASDQAGAIDESVAVVSVQALQLARTQFGYLAKTFEKSGDVISLTLCEIGAHALDKALAGTKPE